MHVAKRAPLYTCKWLLHNLVNQIDQILKKERVERKIQQIQASDLVQVVAPS